MIERDVAATGRRRTGTHNLEGPAPDAARVRAGDVPKRCHACSKGVGIALRNWSGLAKAILGQVFFLLICT